MRYLGGKARIAKRLVAAMDLDKDTDVWEPFCGGANMTEALAPRVRHVLATDVHPALIAMFRAVMSGWDPPDTLSEEEYQAAKDLPDSDPRKAFCGFLCSFSGKWFGGYVRDRRPCDNASRAARRGLARLAALTNIQFQHASFLDQVPEPWDGVIYCDPPYQGTTGYSTGNFDHDRFWRLCQDWARLGATVYVSEYDCPVAHDLVWFSERDRGLRSTKPKPIEKLFRILP